MSKTVWTEEDEKKRTLLIKILEVNHPHGIFKVNSSETMRTEELISWLESINYKVECTIPKGSWYYEGAENELVSNNIIINREI